MQGGLASSSSFFSPLLFFIHFFFLLCLLLFSSFTIIEDELKRRLSIRQETVRGLTPARSSVGSWIHPLMSCI